MSGPLRVLLVAEESAGVQTLKTLAERGHEIVGVMASPERRALVGTTPWHLAQKMGCRTWPASLVKDGSFAEQVRNAKVDLLLNVHSLFLIAPQILDAPRIGSFNLHPGPLPRYAGLNAPSWAIYRDERTHGVTLHKMVPRIDAGPIVYQEIFTIEEGDTGFSLSAKCIRSGIALIKQLLDSAARNPADIPLQPQDFVQRQYFGKEVPESGLLKWSRPARRIFNFIRACDYYPFQSPWPHGCSILDGREISIVSASLTRDACSVQPGSVGETREGRAKVACSDEWLWISRLMVNGSYVAPDAVLKPGDRLKDSSTKVRSMPAEKEYVAR
jgi:methionyl-tRNA formyltransferase